MNAQLKTYHASKLSTTAVPVAPVEQKVNTERMEIDPPPVQTNGITFQSYIENMTLEELENLDFDELPFE